MLLVASAFYTLIGLGVMTTLRLLTVTIIPASFVCLSLWSSHDDLRQQDSTGCHTECQWGFNSHFAFLGLHKFADSTA